MKFNLFPWRYWIIALFLLALPAIVQAQFTFTTNNGAITITGYNGPGGAVVIPDATNGYAVTGIGDFAFEDGTNLTSVTIPGSVTNIGEGPFLGCTSLTNIAVDAGNPTYSSTNAVLFDIANPVQRVVVTYPAGLTTGTYSNSVPSIAGIADYAFADCTSLTNLTVNVLSIGDYAFIGCTRLTDASIGKNPLSPGPNYRPPINVGEAAFIGCTSLSSVFIANTVTNIEGLAFAFCTNLTVAYFQGNAPPNDGTAFYGDPGAIVYYGLGAAGWGATFGGAPTVGEMLDFFFQMTNGSITITGYNNLGGSAVIIPAYYFGYPVTSIGANALFDVNPPITSIIIPDTVTSIGDKAFYACFNLTNIVIPNSVTDIGEDAFYSCGLTTITIPNGVTSIGFQAFAQCFSLTSITIPGSVTSIGDSAFLACTSLTNISVDAANPAYSSLNSVLFDKAQDILIEYPDGLTNNTYTIPNSVASIGGEAFAICAGLTNIVIPNSVTNIGPDAFYFIPSLTSAYFEGNAPPDNGSAFSDDLKAVVYYLPGTTGWGTTFGGAPTELWNPQATALSTAGNQFGFSITGPTNATIVVEACTNLVNPVWLPVSTNMLSASGMASFSDPQRTNFPNRYYRFNAP